MTPEQLLRTYRGYQAASDSYARGNGIKPEDMAQCARAKAEFLLDRENFAHVMNANTIDTGLKRAAILQSLVADFARRLLPLQAFATVFRDVPLEGTNKVNVPYYDLDAGGSTSFLDSDGYVAGDTTTGTREIQIGKRATADVADNTKQYDRKYQGLAFTSEEIARQPAYNVRALAAQKVDKLALDILDHVLGIVTAANYGAAEVSQPAEFFDSDDVADLKEACKLWPDAGRSLVLDSSYDANLMKDPGIKNALNYGGAEAIREGKIPTLMGFNYQSVPTIPANAENLKGFAAFMSAVLVAFAPVPPVEEVRNAGTRFELFVHPTGLVLEYRSFGQPQMDTGSHFIESSYGFEKGNATALKRIVSGA